MDSKWEKMNSTLFHKIKEYNRQHTEPHHEIAEFQNSKNKLFLQIQQKAHNHKCIYVFPRKTHENQRMCAKEDAPLSQELSGKKYNLYCQNPHDETHRQARLSTFHIGKPIGKNSFGVRKNMGVELSKDKQKRVPSQSYQHCGSGSVSRVGRSSHGSRLSVKGKESEQVVPVVVNLIRAKIGHRQVETPKTIKKQSILMGNDSSSSLNSSKQNMKSHLLSNSRVRTIVKSKFKESKVQSRFLTDYIGD